MNRERRWYHVIHIVLIGGCVVLLASLWTILIRQAQTLQPVASDCGCSLAPAHWPGGVLVGTGLLAVVVMIGTARFIVAIALRLIRHQRFAHELSRRSRRVWHHGLQQNILLLDDVAEQAMTVGLIRPVIVVTTTLVHRLTMTEVLTVLRHEQAHARSRDPLRSLCLEAVGATVGWVGGLRGIVNSAYSLRELLADAAATENYARVGGLSGALYKLATSAAPRVVPAFSPNTDRVQKLLDQSWRPSVQWWNWRSIVMAIVLGLGIFFANYLPRATAAVTPTMPTEACWLRQMMCRGAAAEILLMTPGESMSRYGW